MAAAIFGKGNPNGSDSSSGGPGSGPGTRSGDDSGNGSGNGSPGGHDMSEEVFRHQRERMVEAQIRARGIDSPELLAALRRVPRHLFMPEAERRAAYDDAPVPIGDGQTISQPYIVAVMTDLVHPRPGDRVLEVGTGSGYQTAVLAELVREVFTIEIVEPLGRRAALLLQDLGYTNVHTRIGDGHRGWPEAAPFNAIVVTAAPERIPEALKSQLEIGGALVIPVGAQAQELVLVTRTSEGFRQETVTPVRFVPMTGEAEKDR